MSDNPIWNWLTDRNWKTWIGHAAWGVFWGLTVGKIPNVGTWIAVGATGGQFTTREAENAVVHGWKDRAEFGGGLKGFLRATWASIKKDGYFDWLTPWWGLGMVLWRQNTILATALVGSSIPLFIFGHKVLKKKWPWEGMD